MGNIRKACARRIESWHRTSRLQSAMEYLMTYGWAILIIAIVLVALFSLGVFNSANFAPKAPPGACQVFRPNGPGTTFDLNLEGECNGELPQYVAQFNVQQTSSISMQSSPSFSTPRQFTISAWVEPDTLSHYNNIFATNCFRFELSAGPTPAIDFDFNSPNCGGSGALPYVYLANSIVDSFGFYTVTFNNGALNGYYDGLLISSGSTSLSYSTNDITKLHIGADGISNVGGSDNMYGSIANVQIYNTSMSANDINTLYNEGIGGAPIDITNLVGWWPLNGNANDYSGNQNNGGATNVIYTTSWASSYTPP